MVHRKSLMFHYKPGQEPDTVTRFDEFSVLNGKYGVLEKDEFIRELL